VFYLPCRLFFLLSFLLFLPKIRGAGPLGSSPRSTTVLIYRGREQDGQGWELGDKGTGCRRAGYKKREFLTSLSHPPPLLYVGHKNIRAHIFLLPWCLFQHLLLAIQYDRWHRSTTHISITVIIMA